MEPQRLRAIVSQARAGREEAYRELLTVFGPRLYGYFYRATRSVHDAEDLLGEVMLRLVRRLADYDESGRFEPWVFSIAANLVRDRIRRSRTRPHEASLDAGTDESGPLADTVGGPAEPVERRLVQAEMSEQLTAALTRLDETSRQMILLRHFGDMSFKEMAKIFNCPIGTVLAKVHRGLKALREVMEENDEDE